MPTSGRSVSVHKDETIRAAWIPRLFGQNGIKIQPNGKVRFRGEGMQEHFKERNVYWKVTDPKRIVNCCTETPRTFGCNKSRCVSGVDKQEQGSLLLT